MYEKIMQVFYGTDCLPYKDKERQVHYPIVGNSFVGASNTTEIRFYIDRIGDYTDTWVANSKLPNGKLGNKILTSGYDEENEEHYVKLQLSSFYTQAKGDLYISLNGFYGGVEIEENDGQYSIKGIPTIQATGSIKLAINYATPLQDGDEVNSITLAQLLASIGGKLDKNSNNYIKVVDSLYNINTNTYKDYITNGSVVYSILSKKIFSISGTYPNLIATEITLSVSDIEINNLVAQHIVVPSFNNITDSGENSLYDVFLTQNQAKEYVKDVDITSIKTIQQVFEECGGLYHIFIADFAGNIAQCWFEYGTNTDTYKVVLYSSNGVSECDNIAISDTSTTLFRNLEFNTVISYLPHFEVQNGTLFSSDEMKSLSQPNAILTHLGRVYLKGQEDSNNIEFVSVDYDKENTNGYIVEHKYSIVVNKASQMVTNVMTSNTQFYSKSQIDTLFSSALQYKGSLTVAEINALTTSSLKIGDFYNITDSGVITLGNFEVIQGDNIVWNGSSWDKLTMDLSVYDDKFIAAGFFSVEDYDETTGNITFVYASDLYSMSYSDTTGILTIEAQ